MSGERGVLQGSAELLLLSGSDSPGSALRSRHHERGAERGPETSARVQPQRVLYSEHPAQSRAPRRL